MNCFVHEIAHMSSLISSTLSVKTFVQVSSVERPLVLNMYDFELVKMFSSSP